MPMTHVLKSWPAAFEALWEGEMVAQYRRDDGFQVGDTARLNEYDPAADRLTGRWIEAIITDVRRGPFAEIGMGHAMLSIAETGRSE
jgi:hypothetical protein